MNESPFSPEVDPYLPGPAALGRRALLQMLGVVPLVAAALGACAFPRRLGCAPRAAEPERCKHRFCRYYRGG
jgi:hypothetical protein